MTFRPGDASEPLPISQFDYELPPELIAQHPVEPRDASRLLLVDRDDGSLADHQFRDLPALLSPGDLLVLNDTRVLPARLFARRETGGRVELLLLRKLDGSKNWTALVRASRRLRDGEQLVVLDRNDNDTDYRVTFEGRDERDVIVNVENVDAILRECGRVPLPPYITETLDDPERYQTVYSKPEGSAAAPTAGLHFTSELLERTRDSGINAASVTLHVGLDTFQPVTVEDARQHAIHSEWYRVPSATLQAIRAARENRARVVAVGTTVARTLESVAGSMDAETDVSGWSDIYITPPYQFQVVDALITNFHLPRTTLLLMVSAFAGEQVMRRAYQHAIERRYRFYSFGDAMLIM